MALNFESMDEIIKCDYSSKSYFVGFSCGAVCSQYFAKMNFLKLSKAWEIKMMLKSVFSK